MNLINYKISEVSKIEFILILLLSCNLTFGQIDTSDIEFVKYTTDFKFEDGIYLDFTQVKNNLPIPSNKIITTYDENDFEFYEDLLSEKYISLYDNLGIENQYKTEDIWGYCHDGVIYIQKNDNFNRLGVIGSICHFVAYETVYDNTYPYTYGYDSYNTYPSTTTELRQYLLSFESGEIYAYTYSSVEILLMTDSELYDEYINLKKRDKKKLVFVYIRKYNEKHPLMLPVYN